ncbi:MAG TPA: hypothetical protein VMV92_20720 [Streptosporangiaceae bacterium]|nr:hypothetical protein [Streptosporangiaceae bacterium]
MARIVSYLMDTHTALSLRLATALDQEDAAVLAAGFAGAVRDAPVLAAELIMNTFELLKVGSAAKMGLASEADLLAASLVLRDTATKLALSLPPAVTRSLVAKVLDVDPAVAGHLLDAFVTGGTA